MNWSFIATIIALGLLGNGSAEDSSINVITQANALLRTKLAQYDKEVRPAGVNDTGPVVVSINMFVRDIENVDQDKQEWKIQVTFRMKWIDGRLSYKIPYKDFKYISVSSPEKIEQIWKPDLFFGNEREFSYHNGLERNQYIRIYPNGELLHSVRLTTTLGCAMNLYTFPYDMQTCSVKIASYAHTDADILFEWKAEDPVQVTRNLHLRHFALRQFLVDKCDSTTNTGTYSCLNADFKFQRVSSVSWNKGQFPIVVAVFLGWMSFWLPPNSVSRIAIVLASFFYFTQTESSFREKFSPDVSYETIYDKFTCTSFFFILCSVVEFIVVSYLTSRNASQTSQSRNHRSELQGTTDPLIETNGAASNVDEEMEKATPRGNKTYKGLLCLKNSSDRCRTTRFSWTLAIDVVFRITYPIAFIIFLFVFYGNVSLLLASYDANSQDV